MATPTVVLVHGPCGTPAIWSRLVPLLDQASVPSIAPLLRSSLPAADLDDAAFLESVLDDLSGPTVLVGHSGSCFTITEVGEHSSVQHLVYLDGPLPDVGETMRDVYEPGELDPTFAACIKLIQGAAEFDTDALSAHFEARGWPASEAREFTASGFVPGRFAAQVLTVSVASWRTVPSTHIGHADSQAAKSARTRFASRATHAFETQGDHFALWRQPAPLAEIIARIAGSSGLE